MSLSAPQTDSCARPRVTVAAVVEHDGRFLLVEEQTPFGLQLNQPAGHLEAGESPVQGVVRETLEETGRAFTPLALLGVYLASTRHNGPDGAFDQSYLRLAFCGSVSAPDPARKLDTAVVRAVWMDVAAIRASRARHRSPLVLRCVEDYLQGRRFPLDLLYTDPDVGDDSSIPPR